MATSASIAETEKHWLYPPGTSKWNKVEHPLGSFISMRLADRTARFGIAAARLGIVYGVPDSRTLRALVGLAKAKRMLFTAQRFDAVEAARIGFVDEVVAGALEEAARVFAAPLAENAPLSIAGAKLILTALANGEVGERSAEIEAAVERSNESQDYREGVQAFLEKRKPRFTGA